MKGGSSDKRRTDGGDVRKFLDYRMRVHSDLRDAVILANTEWAAQQTWGAEISVSYQEIIEKRYKYNHVHDVESIRKIVNILAMADAA